MRICRNGHKVYDADAMTCPDCGAQIVNIDAARVNAEVMYDKYNQSEETSKFGKFMKTAAKMTMKMCEILEKKAR